MHEEVFEGDRDRSIPALTPAPVNSGAPPAAGARRRIALPIALFVMTCLTTISAAGFEYGACLMVILVCHEFGHFLQALRYRVPASLPYFIPMAPPLGTMGAVIAMGGNMGNRKSLFDIGISGPLAGLVPTVVFCVVGILRSHFGELPDPTSGHSSLSLGEPLFFQFLARLLAGPTPEHQELYLHPMAYAGWVGVFLTAVNLMPIGQLDGGHVLYAMLRRAAHPIATLLLLAAMAAVVATKNYQWLLMLGLLALVGPNHPPTGNDNMPLGTSRVILGWLTLAFVIVGFTPTPFTIQ